MYKLVRDKLPEYYKEQGKPLKTAKVTDPDFAKDLLATKLVTCDLTSLDGLAEAMAVIAALVELQGNTMHDLSEVYAGIIRKEGGFTEHTIVLDASQLGE